MTTEPIKVVESATVLVPAVIVLVGRITAFPGFDDCGTLLNRGRLVAAVPGIPDPCDILVQARLHDATVWLAVACLLLAGYGLQLRRRRRRA